MNATDAFALARGTVHKTVGLIEAYDADLDADLGDLVEDIRALNEDTLIHLRDAGFIEDLGGGFIGT
jgi:hypothetical protein